MTTSTTEVTPDRNTPTPIRPIAPKPNDLVVARLKEWLEMAESGELQGALLLGETTGDINIRSRVGDIRNCDAIYLLRLVEHDILNDAKELDVHTFPGDE